MIKYPSAVALGNFDGIHKGHQQVIQPIFKYPNLTPSLVTFIPHPQEFFTGKKKQLLTPISEKCKILETLGVKQLILLRFDGDLANLTAEKFVKDILIKHIKANFISVGEDFCFGYQRQGNAKYLELLAHQYNVKVSITKEQNLTIRKESIRISSSYIRQNLSQGKPELANEMLGREYQIIGKVIEGQKLGRKIGFPTANLEIPSEKFLPKKGVYGVKVNVENKHLLSNLPGVMNIGTRPTIEGKNISIEIHLLNWHGDLYNQILTVKLLNFIRPEQKFSSIDELKKQIKLDCQQLTIKV
ncbi:bifunctional riboflavin kinase/FAD synthetase [Geminocystis sp. GBBB08]|uniref:bifunctional riboflavin kinase/FAD synthetase n=1 Tax=Geminocystis sp. GBBB08 TaxID=2604140 RepID=UPI0027E2C695|nr:bifunctional riboflavin kinase/FAD synthetase [Geminocystis sp. GBBB08]MBL1208798.1 bifunctional riboflavin kinase/FAD synthetase [Geminocystis sp. GBBB08]